MKVCGAFATLFLCATCACASDVTPVQKVVQLMEGMVAKGKAEKHDEQVQFAAYKVFCDDTQALKETAIKEAVGKIESLKADIDFATATAGALTTEIAKLEKDLATWQADIKTATEERASANADYITADKDYSESIDALEGAIAVLKKKAFDRKQKGSLAQVAHLKGLNLIPPTAKKAIDTFLDQGSSEAAELAVFSFDAGYAASPTANAYEFQSTSIIDMLVKLLDKFTEEITKLQKDEMNSKHEYDMLVQDLNAQISGADESIKTKTGVKAEHLNAKATAEGDLVDTIATKTDDTKYLSELTATCAQKATDFESRQQLRADELEAIVKAIEVVKTYKVTGAAEKYLSASLVQKGNALAQLRGDGNAETQKRVSRFLQRQADKLNSRVLSTLASHAAADPFAKVKKMIKDMITRLLEEANEEASHKAWCDTELATNAATRKEKTSTVEKLTAEIEELTSSIAQLAEDIPELTKAIAELESAMLTATKLREMEKEKNAETIEDCTEAQAAVVQAITILEEFYEKSGTATALMQKHPTALVQKQPGAPAIFDSPYTGLNVEKGGVVAMLEVIESDFAKLSAETKASEASSEKEYNAFVSSSKIDKKAKETALEHKQAKKTDEQSALVSRKSDLEGTQEELDTALAYYDKLKPSCVGESTSFEDRMARRREEIASLKQALSILGGLDLA